jgi:hypothetical protein
MAWDLFTIAIPAFRFSAEKSAAATAIRAKIHFE